MSGAACVAHGLDARKLSFLQPAIQALLHVFDRAEVMPNADPGAPDLERGWARIHAEHFQQPVLAFVFRGFDSFIPEADKGRLVEGGGEQGICDCREGEDERGTVDSVRGLRELGWRAGGKGI